MHHHSQSLHLELIQRSPHLQLHFAAQFHGLIQANQCPKFRIEVIHIELPRLELDIRMQARYANVLKPDLTLMPPPNFNGILVLRTDHMQTALLLALLALVDALEDEIGGFRFLYGDHLHREIRTRPCDQSGERLLANLTLKFSEII